MRYVADATQQERNQEPFGMQGVPDLVFHRRVLTMAGNG